MKIILGLVVSTLGGWLMNWLIVDTWLWPRFKELTGAKTNHPTDRYMVVTLGVVERLLYTFALVMKYPQWIIAWLSFKTIVSWAGWKNDEYRSYNIFLVGNANSILFGLLGAWIALGHLPQ